MKNWFKLKTFESFDPTIDLNKVKIVVEKKSIEDFRKLFESVQSQDLSKDEMSSLGIEHGKAFAEAGNEFDAAKVYSETHDMAYIDGFKSAYGKFKVGE